MWMSVSRSRVFRRSLHEICKPIQSLCTSTHILSTPTNIKTEIYDLRIREVHTSSLLAKGSTAFMKYGTKKMAKDTEKAAVISKILKRIEKSVISAGGNADPETNKELAAAIAACKEVGMAPATLDRAMQRVQSLKEDKCKQYVFGPGDSLFHVTSMFGKRQRNQFDKSIKNVLTKLSTDQPGSFGFAEKSLVEQTFEEKGVLVLLADSSESGASQCPAQLSLEAAETLAIEIGAEDVVNCTDDLGNPAFQFVLHPHQLATGTEEVRKRGYDVQKSEKELHPLYMRALSADQLQLVVQMYEAFDKIDLVEHVTDNIAWPDDRVAAER